MKIELHLTTADLTNAVREYVKERYPTLWSNRVVNVTFAGNGPSPTAQVMLEDQPPHIPDR